MDASIEQGIATAMSKKEKPVVRIRDWNFSKTDHGNEVMFGTVCEGHARLAAGEDVRTSRIIRKDEVNKVVETLNTIYILE